MLELGEEKADGYKGRGCGEVEVVDIASEKRRMTGDRGVMM